MGLKGLNRCLSINNEFTSIRRLFNYVLNRCIFTAMYKIQPLHTLLILTRMYTDKWITDVHVLCTNMSVCDANLNYTMGDVKESTKSKEIKNQFISH